MGSRRRRRRGGLTRNFHPSLVLLQAPSRRDQPTTPIVGHIPVMHSLCLPTHELLRKRSYNNGNWNLLEAETWEMRDVRQRTLVPPLRDRQGVLQLDSSSVWERRVRLQMALLVESKMEAWLESIGRGAEEERRPSHARTAFMHPETAADSDTPWDAWGTPYRWSSPTQVDAEPSEMGSGYEAESWSEVGDE